MMELEYILLVSYISDNYRLEYTLYRLLHNGDIFQSLYYRKREGIYKRVIYSSNS
jgi:hypothetical protein